MTIAGLIIGLLLLAGAAATWVGTWRGWADWRGPFTDHLYLPPMLTFLGLAAVLWAFSDWAGDSSAGAVLDIAAGICVAGVVFTLFWWNLNWMPRWYRDHHAAPGQGTDRAPVRQ